MDRAIRRLKKTLDREGVIEEEHQGVMSGDLELILIQLERKSRVRNIFKCKEM